MSHHIDEFSKSLAAESVSRRDAFRLLGAALAGAILAPFGLRTARAGAGPVQDLLPVPQRQQQNACLAACYACGGDTNRLCGNCGSFVCCDEPDPYEKGACVNGQCVYWCVEGAVKCDGICTSLAEDRYNCGACGFVCGEGEYCEDGVCQVCIPDCGPGSTHGAGWCGDDGCGGRCACQGQGEYCPAFSNWCALSTPTEF